MTIRISKGARATLANDNGFKGIFDDGVIYILSSAQAASANNGNTGTVLGIATLDGGAWAAGSPTNGLVWEVNTDGSDPLFRKPAAASWRGLWIANGTVASFRTVGNDADDITQASTALPRIDGTVGRTGTDAIISTTAAVIGQPFSIDVFEFPLPESR